MRTLNKYNRKTVGDRLVGLRRFKDCSPPEISIGLLKNMPILNFAAKRGFFRRQGVLSYACYWGGTDTILNLILPLHRTPPLLTIPKMWGLHECLSTVSLASLGNRNASQSLFPLPLKWHGRPGSDNKPLYCAFHEACQRSAD